MADTYYLGDLITFLELGLKDNANWFTYQDKENFIKSALRSVGRDLPQVVVFDIAGTGTDDYALPASYVKGFSSIRSVEYPAGETPPRYIFVGDDYIIYEDPDKVAGQQMRIRFMVASPTASETIRVNCTSPHTVTATTSTLDAASFDATVFKATEYACNAAVAKIMQAVDPSIAADSVRYMVYANDLRQLAKTWESRYKEAVGRGDCVKGAFATSEGDLPGYRHGGDFVWFPKRVR
jgi:hypothetical protein